MPKPQGETHHSARLNQAKADAIRAAYRPHDPEFGGKPLAEQYGVSPVAIWKIVHGKTWKPAP